MGRFGKRLLLFETETETATEDCEGFRWEDRMDDYGIEDLLFMGGFVALFILLDLISGGSTFSPTVTYWSYVFVLLRNPQPLLVSPISEAIVIIVPAP